MYVLMVTPNKFPNGDAGAIRDEYFAMIYQELGYDVIHIGYNRQEHCGNYKGIEFYSLYRSNNNILKKIINLFSYKIRLKKLVNLIEKKYGKAQLYHIYDIPKSGINLLRSSAIKHKIPIIHDSVEWYSPCEFRFGRLSYPYIIKKRLNTSLIRKPISVIAISRYLENYFKEKGIITIRIPVIMDYKDYIPKVRVNDNKIKLIYAGSPANKDYICECIIAFSLLQSDIRSKFEFNIFGVDETYVKRCLNGKLIPQIKAYGRVDRSIVISCLEESDFSLLLRPNEEIYTKAGFPTKLVEAMMNGCAMICNYTSDMELYLKDNRNSIIVEDCDIEELKKTFIRISKMSMEQIVSIKNNARETAINNFDYRLYIKDISVFIDKLKGEIDDNKNKEIL